jgi:hypothetical protein
MARKIVAYGHTYKSGMGIADEEELVEYMTEDIFTDDYECRYRYSQSKDADIILMSFHGLAYGHFDIASKVAPTAKDKRLFPPTRSVYIVEKSSLYSTPVRLSELGITAIQFGKALSERTFKAVLARAGRIRNFRR